MSNSGQPVVPFIGVLVNNGIEDPRWNQFLRKQFGPFSHQSDQVPFTATDYYREEMGEHVTRLWLAPDTSSIEGALPERKKKAIELESEASERFPVCERPLNLDPGYVRGNQVVLASTKNADHRLYIGSGLYAELTLLYEAGRFQPMPWTYMDYRSDTAHSFFVECRNLYFSSEI